MKAVAVFPGKANSAHLAALDKPSLDSIPNGRGVLVRVLRVVGVLLEPFTVVQKGITQAYEIQRRLRVWRPRKAAVMGAGTIGLLATLSLRLRGIEVTSFSLQPKPNRRASLLEALGARYISTKEMPILNSGK